MAYNPNDPRLPANPVTNVFGTMAGEALPGHPLDEARTQLYDIHAPTESLEGLAVSRREVAGQVIARLLSGDATQQRQVRLRNRELLVADIALHIDSGPDAPRPDMAFESLENPNRPVTRKEKRIARRMDAAVEQARSFEDKARVLRRAHNYDASEHANLSGKEQSHMRKHARAIVKLEKKAVEKRQKFSEIAGSVDKSGRKNSRKIAKL